VSLLVLSVVPGCGSGVTLLVLACRVRPPVSQTVRGVARDDLIPQRGDSRRRFHLVGFDRALRTAFRATTANQIFALTIIIAMRREGGGCSIGAAEHIEATQPTLQETAQQVRMMLVVTKGQV